MALSSSAKRKLRSKRLVLSSLDAAQQLQSSVADGPEVCMVDPLEVRLARFKQDLLIEVGEAVQSMLSSADLAKSCEIQDIVQRMQSLAPKQVVQQEVDADIFLLRFRSLEGHLERVSGRVASLEKCKHTRKVDTLLAQLEGLKQALAQQKAWYPEPVHWAATKREVELEADARDSFEEEIFDEVEASGMRAAAAASAGVVSSRSWGANFGLLHFGGSPHGGYVDLGNVNLLDWS